MVTDATDKKKPLEELAGRTDSCLACALGDGRTRLVFGDGSPGARLMFVGEAPGYHEDQQGLPFVGQAGQLLARMLERIGLTRPDVYITNVIKCRPPGNRDPLPAEIEACRGVLEQQIAIIRPAVICSLGNFATKLLSGKPDGISRVHGQPQPLPGHEGITLYPVFHPAAALYTPSNVRLLEEDFDRLAGLLGLERRPVAEADDEALPAAAPEEQPDPEEPVESSAGGGAAEPGQMNLF